MGGSGGREVVARCLCYVKAKRGWEGRERGGVGGVRREEERRGCAGDPNPRGTCPGENKAEISGRREPIIEISGLGSLEVESSFSGISLKGLCHRQ